MDLDLIFGSFRDAAQQRDIDATRRALRDARHLAWQRAEEQDGRLEALQADNVHLRLCLLALVQTLVSNGVVSQGEVQEIIDAVMPARPDPEPTAAGAADEPEPTTPELHALARAARSSGL